MAYYAHSDAGHAALAAFASLTGGGALNAKRLLYVAVAVWCTFFSCQLVQAGSKAKVSVFAHVNVVPMDGKRILVDQNVTVVDERISSIEPAATATVPSGSGGRRIRQISYAGFG